MIAKIIVHASTREMAVRDLERVCSSTEIAPIKSNAGFLTRLLRSDPFKRGGVTTDFIGTNEDALTNNDPKLRSLERDAAIALLIQGVRDPCGTTYSTIDDELESIHDSNPWRQCLGFRVNKSPELSGSFFLDGERVIVPMTGDWRDEWVSSERAEGGLFMFEDGECLTIKTRFDGNSKGAVSDGTLIAPMPGKVTAVDVDPGDTVTKGQRILTLEAMKMEHGLVAPFDGTVAEISVEPGAQVQVEAVLARIEPTGTE